jgi:hypothetical protein
VSSYLSFEQLLSQAHDLPLGDAKVAMFTSAVREADLSRSLEDRFGTRLALIRAATFSGRYETALPAFAWCVAQYERAPEKYAAYEYSLLWQFKGILYGVVEAPQIEAEQVEQLLQQMTILYRRTGRSQRTVDFVRYRIAMQFGDRATTTSTYAKWRSKPRDASSDCIACEADSEVSYFELLDDHDRAIAVAEPCLSRTLQCAEVPHRTIATTLRSFALAGRYEEGDRFQREGYRLIRSNREFIQKLSLHIAYLVHRERFKEASQLVERHIHWAVTTHERRGQYYFYLAAEMACERLAAVQPRSKLRLPAAIADRESDGPCGAADAEQWFRRRRKELGSRFDARCSSSFYGEELPRLLAY